MKQVIYQKHKIELQLPTTEEELLQVIYMAKSESKFDFNSKRFLA